ncbi:TetR/AcrR family transcriptional regulator [Mycobacterium sp. Aquia_216]|uniref:TetR/AcrR family transcriptional regulator n=1 Tax=Mycobacterium sp. Aquia_216 TaxID=2991729 RepID=UPI00227C5F79|nr:TetR/AcrR family transcriptional regulator [Mycobacterium sp. Aquia_216]WAJ43785.1 TetR/AcrR family transcriptional regulator [Mycobacterium sp. Aquia_216]
MDSLAAEAATTSTQRPRSASPTDRLLVVATKLFATHGIRAVGIERILRESGCAKASLYDSYGSKAGLVAAYLTQLDRADRDRWEKATETAAGPIEKALAFFDLAIAKGLEGEFPGCLYSNVATEFPGVRFEPVDGHRRWVRSSLTELMNCAGAPQPDVTAQQIQLLYDGALAGSKLEESVEPIRLGRSLAADLIDRACRR